MPGRLIADSGPRAVRDFPFLNERLRLRPGFWRDPLRLKESIPDHDHFVDASAREAVFGILFAEYDRIGQD